MYKIFIDTNIILNFYRLNNTRNIQEILKEIKKYKKYFISTQQSKEEFLRNRNRTIQDFLSELKKQNYNIHANNVIATLSGYDEYAKSVENANKNTRKIINEVNELINKPEVDLIYDIFLTLNEQPYERTEEIIEKAIKRKMIGNPPTSNKYTCGDEIIWESILENCNEDLIIVSRDSTFADNYVFLKDEYEHKTGKELKVVETISSAIELNNEPLSQELEFIESDIIMDDELKTYGKLQENANWTNIIYNALITLNNKASLKEIYKEVRNTVSERYPEKLKNKHIDDTVRGVLQRYSSDSKYFNGKYDLFVKIKKGVWGLRHC